MMKLIRGIFAMFLCLTLCVFMAPGIYAADEIRVIQAYLDSDNINLFISGISGGDFSCKISNLDCDIRSSGLINQAEIPVYTMFLIDSSTSIRKASQKTVDEMLRQLIENKPAKDLFAIVAFGEEVRTVKDFSSDRYELAKAVDSLEYNDQQSSIYDAVKLNTASLSQIDGSGPFLSQLVVISDGIEKADDGIIKEELFFHLRENPYPVHTIGFKYENNADGLKELYAISRITGAKSFDIDSNTDISTLAQDVGDFGSQVYWASVTPPAELRDGSLRQLDIASSGTRLQYDVKMPLSQIQDESTPEPVAEPVSEASDDERQPIAPVEPQKSALPEWWWIAAIGAVVVLAGIGAVIFIVKKNKKKPLPERQAAPEPQVAARDAQNQTQMLGSEGKTEFLIPQSKPTGNSIVLIDIKQAHKRFEAPCTGEIIIGRDREKCNIVIDYDRNVSRQHCKIYKTAGVFWVEDLGSANKTYVNDIPVNGPKQIKNKDILALGKLQFSVTLNN